LCFNRVELELASILLKAGAQKELAIAHSACPPHPAVFLDVTESQIVEVCAHVLRVLVCKDTQFISASLASFVSTELAGVFVTFLKFFIAHDTLCVLGKVSFGRPFQGKNTVCQLKAHFFITYSQR